MKIDRRKPMIVILFVSAVLNFSFLSNASPASGLQNYTLIGEWGSFGLGDGEFVSPRDIAIDSDGEIFVFSDYRVQKFSSDGSVLLKIWGSPGSGDGEFQTNGAVAVDSSDNIYVADESNNRIQKFDNDGDFIMAWTGPEDHLPPFSPVGIDIDSSDNVFATDNANSAVWKFDTEGNLITVWGSSGSETGQFNAPVAVDIDSVGNVFVADNNNARIQKFDNDGIFISTWGSFGSGDDQFSEPAGIAIDSFDNVYVTDSYNSNFQKFSNDGSTLLAKFETSGFVPGLNTPIGLEVDSLGKVYVVDSGNARVVILSQVEGIADTPKTDFNGDGFEDLAISAPNDSINGKANAGVVNVVFGSSSGISATAVPDQRFFQDIPGIAGISKVNDLFGTAITAGDFNGDGYTDLSVGSPGDDYASTQTGAINVIYGSASGLSATAVLTDQIWTFASPNLGDEGTYCLNRPHSNFGSELTSGDFNGDGYDDLAIGSPSDGCEPEEPPTGGVSNGALNIIYGSSTGLSTTAARADQYRNGDWFESYGDSLATGDFNNDGFADLVVGESFEEFSQGMAGGPGSEGHVEVYYGSSSGLLSDSSNILTGAEIWEQDSQDIEGEGEGGDSFGVAISTGDFNGDDYDDLAIGTAEDVGTPNVSEDNTDEGSVHIIYGSIAGLSATIVQDQLFDQNSPNVEGTKEVGDRFGSSLASGDFNGDGRDDLALGASFEDVGPTVDAGSSNIIYGSPTGLSPTAILPDRVLDQNSNGVDGTSETGDGFGWSIASGDFNDDGRDDLAFGIPNEDVGTVVDAGSSNIIYGSASGISSTASLADRVLDQNSANVKDSSETRDRFGSALA